MGGADRAVLEMHTRNEVSRKAQLNHDMWVRIKEHQERLRGVLVHEAKKDLYEKLVQEQAYLDKDNQERAHRMYEWEERKLVTEALKKQEELRKKEHERLEKEHKQEKCQRAFKEWLKQSLIKQQKDVFQKKIEKYNKRRVDEEQKKVKESMKVMANIAYREWKERKTEQSRHKKKIDAMERRREKLEAHEEKMARRHMVMEMKRRQGGGGGQILLAYGLNKNMKNYPPDHQPLRAKSAKPRKEQRGDGVYAF